MTGPQLKLDSRDIFFIALILLSALILRAFFFADYQKTEVYPLMDYSDSYYYYVWARDIASGDLMGDKAFMKWPLYAYLVGFIFWLSKNSVLSVYLLQAVLGACNCVLVYLMGRVLFSKAAAIIAGLLAAWYGFFIFYDYSLMYTSVSLFLNSFLFLYMLQIREAGKTKNLFWLGVFSGACAITQAGIVLFCVPAAAWIAWQQRRGLKEAVKKFLFFSLGMGLMIGAVTVKNFAAEKDFVLIAGNLGFNFYSGNSPRATGTFFAPAGVVANQEDMFRDAKIIARTQSGRELKTSGVSRFWLDKSLDFIKKEPLQFAQLLGKKIVYLLSPREFVHDFEYEYIKDKIRVFKVLFMDLGVILPLGVLGMLLGMRRPRDFALLYLALISLSAATVTFFVTTRYRIGLVPFLILFAAFAVCRIGEAFRERKYLAAAALCAAAIILYGLFNYSPPFAASARTNTPDMSSEFHRHLDRAIRYEHAREYREAIRELDIARAIEPDDPRALLRSGIVYFFMNEFGLAEERFKGTIAACPYCFDAYFNLGVMYRRQSRFQEALQMLKKAISLYPEDIGAHFHLGKVYEALGEAGEAEKEFTYCQGKISRWRKGDLGLVADALRSLQ